MLRIAHKPTAWSMIAVFAIISAFGEGIHYIPGCEHATPTGEKYLLLGIDSSGIRTSPDGSRKSLESKDTNIPIYDEDECAICSVIGHKVASGDSYELILVTPLVQELPSAEIPFSPAAPTFRFQARAPPLV